MAQASIADDRGRQHSDLAPLAHQTDRRRIVDVDSNNADCGCRQNSTSIITVEFCPVLLNENSFFFSVFFVSSVGRRAGTARSRGTVVGRHQRRHRQRGVREMCETTKRSRKAVGSLFGRFEPSLILLQQIERRSTEEACVEKRMKNHIFVNIDAYNESLNSSLN